MTYALVIKGEIVETARLPHDLVRLDDGTKPLYSDFIDAKTLAACGWFPVLDMRPTFDTATEVLERGDVFLSDPTTPVVSYTIRDKSPAELAAEADAADRQAKGVRVGQAVTWLRNHAQTARNTTATTNNSIAVLNALLDDLPVVYDGLADLLEYLKADRLGEE